jgi:hypothetical protein
MFHNRQLPRGCGRDHLLLDRPIDFRAEILKVDGSIRCATTGGVGYSYFVDGGLLHECRFLWGDVFFALLQVGGGFGGPSRRRSALKSFSFALNHGMRADEENWARRLRMEFFHGPHRGRSYFRHSPNHWHSYQRRLKGK